MRSRLGFFGSLLRSSLLPSATVLVLLSIAAGCDDDDVPPANGDAGTTTDSGGGDTDSTTPDTGSPPVDAGPPPIRCTAADFAAGDFTDGGATGAIEITFEKGANPKQYGNRCVTVKVGAVVTWSGSFSQHPLEAAGGDSPNPIPSTATNPPSGKLDVTFTTAGTFGFQCTFHSTSMFGAVKVVP